MTAGLVPVSSLSSVEGHADTTRLVLAMGSKLSSKDLKVKAGCPRILRVTWKQPAPAFAASAVSMSTPFSENCTLSAVSDASHAIRAENEGCNFDKCIHVPPLMIFCCVFDTLSTSRKPVHINLVAYVPQNSFPSSFCAIDFQSWEAQFVRRMFFMAV